MADRPRRSQPPDEWIQRAKRGDPEAIRLLYEFFETLLRSRVRSHLPAGLRSKVAASDVIQEAWVTAHQRLDSFEIREGSSFESWLYKIVDHKLRDQIRRFRTGKRDARREGPDVEAAQPPGKTRTPSSVVSGKEEWEALDERVRRLPERARLVLDLVHRESLPWGHVGARMGCSAEAARKLYARAIGRLGDEPNGARPRAGKRR